MTGEVVLPEVPGLGALYVRGMGAALRLAAARRAGTAPTTLPDVVCAVHDTPIELDRLSAYQGLLGMRAADRLPAGFVHVMTFPVQVALMTRADFPLPPMGMLHVASRITQLKPLWRDDRLDLRISARDLRPHRSGTQVDLVAQVCRSGSSDVAWEGVSTYLARGVHLPPTPVASEQSTPVGVTSSDVARGRGGGEEADGRAAFVPPVPTASWRLAADTGRRYAGVSGDRNPVHLSALTARPFGFKRAIAHGMYTAARALAEVGPAAGHTFLWTADFTKPVLLPATVAARVAPEGDGFGYAVWQPDTGRPYLTGRVEPLP